MARQIVKEWTYHGKHSGWSFTCGLTTKGTTERFYIRIEDFPTADDAGRAAHSMRAYWKRWHKKGLTPARAAAIQSATAKGGGGQVAKNSFAARAQCAAARQGGGKSGGGGGKK